MRAPWIRVRAPRLDGSRHPTSRSSGQVLVIFALGLTALMAAAGLAFDVGRFYAERRFLQNATDAAALAGAASLSRGNTTTQAAADALAVLNGNLAGDPNGQPIVASSTPVYAAGHAGDPSSLISGVLVSGGSVRAAIQNSIGYTFGRVVGLNNAAILARSLVQLHGDLVPVALRHYINAPGPSSGAASPCPGNTAKFMDLASTADTSCLGSTSDASLRVSPSVGSAFSSSTPNNDPSHHGPIVVLVGQGAAPSNAADFRGFVALDVRDFSDANSNVFYNGVTVGTQPNALKNLEAGWIAVGYPGPDFPPATTPPDPNDQVGIMDGNSAGIVVADITARYAPGDEILVAVYSGVVMTIPDFTVSVPGSVSIGTSQDISNTIKMTVDKNASFTGVVTTTAFADPSDSANPLSTGTMDPITFSPQPATPKTTVTWTHLNTTAAPTGVYTIWVLGHSGSPYLTDHYNPVAINVGGVARDFSNNDSLITITTASTGVSASASTTFTTGNGASAFSGDVHLTVEGGPGPATTLPAGIGSISISPNSFELDSNARQAVTVTIDAGNLGPGQYNLTLRASGTNSAGQKVTHLIPIQFNVATAGTSKNYVDIEGFVVFRVTSTNANSVSGYAITPVYADESDARLARGLVGRLVPWY